MWLRNIILLSSCVILANLSHAATVAAGKEHSCEIRSSDGAVRCWGTNGYGQLGNGQVDTTESSPLVVLELAGVQAITAGKEHTCALKAGAVHCWGRGTWGQLGNGDNESMASPQPVTIPGTVVAVDAGDNHTCAVTDDGLAYCWGVNEDGQLGNGTFDDSSAPKPVADLTGVSRISAGREHTCALAEGAAYCWGSNSHAESGQHDNYEEGADIPLPAPMATLQNATDISAGAYSSCAIQQGSVYCWGQDFTAPPSFDKLGSLPINPIPAVVEGLQGASAVVVGDSRACAVAVGQLFCWGSNDFGALGIGSGAEWADSPTELPDLSHVSSVALGSDHMCARASRGVACWGSDDYEQLGDRHDELSNTAFPQSVSELANVVAIDGDSIHTCAVHEGGDVMCWGYNGYGAADPMGSATPVSRPRAVAGASNSGAVRVATGAAHSCALGVDGTIKCWGVNVFSGVIEPPTEVPLPESRIALSITAGWRHTCVVAHNADADTTEVYCWGQNGSGQLGVGDQQGRAAPTPVSFPVPMTSVDGIAAGSEHTCAWQGVTDLYCWGDNASGQLGIGNQPDQSEPAKVTGVDRVTKVRAGTSHTCAEQWIPLSSVTRVYCWGSDGLGEQGNGSANQGDVSEPQLVGTLSLLGAGGDGVCAWSATEGYRCWGRNNSGQLASTPFGVLHMPSPTEFLDIADAAMGDSHTCVLTSNGTVQCAGDGRLGQRGDGSRVYVSTPLFVDHLFHDGFD